MSEGLARNHHQSRKRLAQFQNQENRARRRERKEGQAGENRHVQIREQAEACKYDDEPEDQDDEKRSRNHLARLRKQDETGLYQIGAELRRAGLKRALEVVLRGKRLDRQISLFPRSVEFKWLRCAGLLLAPKPIGKRANETAHLFADRTGFRSILRKQIV